MRLDELIGAAVPHGGAPVEVSALAYDSRKVTPGTLFFCVRGFQSDGHDFAEQAERDGAVALIVERPLELGVPELLVESSRAVMGPIAARFYGEPSAELRVIGITGTNGKTTTAFLAQGLMEAGGDQCGLLGTVKSIVGGQTRSAQRTTAEAIDLQADLRAMLEGGDRGCVMEVSSHALELGRVAGVRFAATIFTNLTQDHLDFHDTMEDYFQAKRLLFLVPSSGIQSPVAVINIDDPYGRRLAGELPGAVTYAIDRPAAYRAEELQVSLSGTRFTLRTPSGTHAVSLPLPGRFNVANALAALAALHALGGDLEVLLAGLGQGVRVPGRFEPVEGGQDFAVLVDYAHTPDSLQNILRAAREVTGPDGRVLCVFGAGGDRDRGKRPLMGEIAARLADVAIVTSDNPRSEQPEAIIEEIISGVGRDCSPLRVQVDRRVAIGEAVALASSGDVVVIAGKGHEQGQEFEAGRKLPFDDVAVAEEELRALAGRAGTGTIA